MTVFCVHSVIEHQQKQLDFPQALSWTAPDNGQAVRSVREGGMDRPSLHKSHPAGSLSSSQPGGPLCWVISLTFGLVGLTVHGVPALALPSLCDFAHVSVLYIFENITAAAAAGIAISSQPGEHSGWAALWQGSRYSTSWQSVRPAHHSTNQYHPTLSSS